MVCLVCLLLFSLQQIFAAGPASFNQPVVATRLHTTRVREASGLAASRVHPGILFTINDRSHSTPENKVYAIDAKTGNLNATITIDGSFNGDWEAIAVGPCSNGASCIFVGDLGEDTEFDYPRNVIYRIQEPVQLITQNVHFIDQLEFSWEEPESECLMVDPSGNAYVISRVKGGHGMMARLPASGWNGPVVEFLPANLTRLSISTSDDDPQACDISPDGKELLIRTHKEMYYWAVPDGDYMSAIEKPGTVVPNHVARTGEAVAWTARGDGYYTLAEGTYKNIYFYSRKSSAIIG